jgi:hypothetical protein
VRRFVGGGIWSKCFAHFRVVLGIFYGIKGAINFNRILRRHSVSALVWIDVFVCALRYPGKLGSWHTSNSEKAPMSKNLVSSRVSG